MARYLGLLALVTVGAALPPAASLAQTRAESVVPARVLVLKKCPLAGDIPIDANKATEMSLAGPAGTLVAGLAGDLVSASLNVVASAIDEASKEKALGGRGVTTFPFYEFGVSDGPLVSLDDTLKANGSACLVISIDTAKPLQPGYFSALEAVQGSAQRELEEHHLADPRYAPALYLEADLISVSGGFVVRPAFVWYPSALPGAPRRKSASELQLTFAGPGGDANGQLGQTFAIARVVTPALAPGDILDRDSLAGYSSPVLSKRPDDAILTAQKSAINSAVQALAAAEILIEDRRLAASRAQEDANSPGADAAKKAAVLTSTRALEDAERARDRAAQDLGRILQADAVRMGGPTTVEAKLLLVRNPNALGQAIAKSLKTRGATAGSDITAALTPVAKAPDWDAATTAYVKALNAVAAAELALQQVQSSGAAPGDILAKENDLREKKAEANEKAVAAHRPLPYAKIF